MTGAAWKQISRTYILWAWFIYASEVIMLSSESQAPLLA